MPIHGFPGGVISSTAVTPSVNSASGVWTLDEQFQNSANWPGAPTFLSNSVRTRSSASAYLTRTASVSPTNNKIMTLSMWVKRGALGSPQQSLMSSPNSGNADNFRFSTSDTLSMDFQDGAVGQLTTTQVFRDPSSWYHIVLAIDTTQATASNRAKIYVNGSQVTAFGTASYPAQNTVVTFSGANAVYLGRYGNAAQNYFDGYLADVNFIDGQALTPNYFGAIDGATGVWEPATYRGTYGTNGFYLPFNLNTTPAFGGFTGDISSSFNTLPTGSQGSNFQFTGNFTIEGWVLFPSASTGDGSFYVSSDGSGFLAFNIDVAGGVYNIYMNSGVPTAIISSDIKAGSWTHVAMVRNGSTVTLYTNGAVRGSFTNSSTVGYSTLTINRFGGGASGQRYLSNVRAVKAAVYTSAFTPPTSPLTSIANTLFLTYQNSTAIDNGPNAFAIGTTGTVTFSTQYPFTLNIASDQSGNGNNWTPINISLANNSTFDSMTDVPTLTSATAANFCTLNPLSTNASGSIVNALSNANLQSSTSTVNTVTLTTMGIPISSSLKVYSEFVMTANGGGAPIIGIGSASAQTLSGTAPCVSYRTDGRVEVNGSTVTTTTSWTTNDVIAMAVDMTTSGGQITFYKNNTSIYTVTGLISQFGSNDIFFGTQTNASSTTTFVANFGQRPFAYTPPTGFVALNTFNLPTPTIGATASTQAGKYFNTILYTGTGSTRTQTGVGFQPDFTWVKRRDGVADHGLMDAVRGASQRLQSNLTAAEDPFGFTAFAPDGFTFNGAIHNDSGWTFVAWNWNAGGSTVTNTSGTISAQVRANTTAGFSIVTYTGNASVASFGHGLGVTPNLIIIKNRSASGSGSNWCVGANISGLSWNWNTDYLYLNTSGAKATDGGGTQFWSAPTSTVVNIGGGTNTNGSGNSMVAYCFAAVAGYSSFGVYTGNGSADGPFVFTGFRPRYVLIRRTDSGNNWFVLDTARDTFNLANDQLLPNSSAAESTGSDCNIDMVSNGFKLRTALDASNGSGGTYIYAAFAESPFKYANAR